MIYIWLVFAVIFSGLAIYHFWQSAAKIKHVESKGQIKTFNGIPLGIGEFVQDFNAYVDELNQRHRVSNLLAGSGYSAAALTAVFSFWLSF